ncbi:hypothetical protein BJ508DRAFT_312216 [Ascobolus immersus RN42]|uniref:Cyanovirin-N domain-containing protein n=1 Tax=Ascobolus immersus RN42 TaxID=1160509 RepID=A0A3N4HMW5_ASCIM|nr:hypothetical protein BJ508DRAFT_312216 [Ascobolus immersus RN42]
MPRCTCTLTPSIYHNIQQRLETNAYHCGQPSYAAEHSTNVRSHTRRILALLWERKSTWGPPEQTGTTRLDAIRSTSHPADSTPSLPSSSDKKELKSNIPARQLKMKLSFAFISTSILILAKTGVSLLSIFDTCHAVRNWDGEKGNNLEAWTVGNSDYYMSQYLWETKCNGTLQRLNLNNCIGVNDAGYMVRRKNGDFNKRCQECQLEAWHKKESGGRQYYNCLCYPKNRQHDQDLTFSKIDLSMTPAELSGPAVQLLISRLIKVTKGEKYVNCFGHKAEPFYDPLWDSHALPAKDVAGPMSLKRSPFHDSKDRRPHYCNIRNTGCRKEVEEAMKEEHKAEKRLSEVLKRTADHQGHPHEEDGFNYGGWKHAIGEKVRKAVLAPLNAAKKKTCNSYSIAYWGCEPFP